VWLLARTALELISQSATVQVQVNTQPPAVPTNCDKRLNSIKMMKYAITVLTLLCSLWHRCRCFCVVHQARPVHQSPVSFQLKNNNNDVDNEIELKMELQTKSNNIFDYIGNFFRELDAFVDDATNRRLGNGWRYYGKRKSAFYGEDDVGRKSDMDMPDPTEDYQGPQKSGYFQWMPDENGELKPVTRMKKTNIERSPTYWDRVYSSQEENPDASK